MDRKRQKLSLEKMTDTVQKEILTKIRDTYVPFLKILIPFVEKNKIATLENLNKLKAMHKIFATAPPVEQVRTFLDNKTKLEAWYKKAEKKKRSCDTSDSEPSEGDTEKELEIILDSKDARKSKNKTHKDNSLKKQKDRNVAQLVELEKRKSMENLFNSTHQSFFSDSDSDDSVIPTKMHNERILKLKNDTKILKIENSNLKAENKSLKAKFDEVYQLNIQLQKKLLNSPKSSLLLSQYNEVNSSISPSLTAATSDLTKSCASITEAKVPERSESTVQVIEEEQFKLDESHLSKIMYRVKSGQSGDSMFVKNLATAVFSNEVLKISSVTGAKCNAKKGSVAKPALCPKRLEYIKKLFHERMAKETPECPIHEKNKRINKVNAFIAEKIITLGRKK